MIFKIKSQNIKAYLTQNIPWITVPSNLVILENVISVKRQTSKLRQPVNLLSLKLCSFEIKASLPFPRSGRPDSQKSECDCCGCGLDTKDEIRSLGMKRMVQGFIIKIGGRCQGIWTEGGGMQEWPQMSSFFFLPSYSFCFSLSSAFKIVEHLWRIGRSSDSQTLLGVGCYPLFLLPSLFLSCPLRTQVIVWDWALCGEHGYVFLERLEV